MKPLLMLRIVVIRPPLGVEFAVQRGRSDLLAPVEVTPEATTFEFSVSVADSTVNPPRLTGEFAQGPPTARFVYVNSGTLAGQSASCWTRRAKVPLVAIGHKLLQAAEQQSGAVLEARIQGTARDGGPACATVPLLGAWMLTA
jgi:hypothetical protein